MAFGQVLYYNARMSTEIKLVTGIIILSIGVTFLGLKLAYKAPSEAKLAITAATMTAPDAPSIKGASSTVSIVEFADFECPACAAMHSIFKNYLKEEGSKVTFTFRNFPIHANADKFSVAALAAGRQGKFWEMHGMMFENQTTWDELSLDKKMETFAGYAQKLGLNMTKYSADLNDPALAEIVKKDKADAIAMGVTATPTIIINNNRIIVGGKNLADLKKIVDEEIAKGPVTLK